MFLIIHDGIYSFSDNENKLYIIARMRYYFYLKRVLDKIKIYYPQMTVTYKFIDDKQQFR